MSNELTLIIAIVGLAVKKLILIIKKHLTFNKNENYTKNKKVVREKCSKKRNNSCRWMKFARC